MSTLKGFRPYTSLLTNAKSKFSTSSMISAKSHYDTLGITRKATQKDVKSAYYKLTMIYHPDKNKSEDAKTKFRAVTDAYEVLGNHNSRKMYDRGMRPTSRPVDNRTAKETQKEDAQTRFYRARMHRSKISTTDGQNPIYNFDEWARAHYGNMMERRMSGKQNYDRLKYERETAELQTQNNQILVALMIVILLTMTLFYQTEEGKYDVNTINSDKSKSQPP